MFENADSRLIEDPMLKAEANEPMLPMLNADPMLPIESTDPREPMHRKLSVEAMHHRPRRDSGTLLTSSTLRAEPAAGKGAGRLLPLTGRRGPSGPAT